MPAGRMKSIDDCKQRKTLAAYARRTEDDCKDGGALGSGGVMQSAA